MGQEGEEEEEEKEEEKEEMVVVVIVVVEEGGGREDWKRERGEEGNWRRRDNCIIVPHRFNQ